MKTKQHPLSGWVKRNLRATGLVVLTGVFGWILTTYLSYEWGIYQGGLQLRGPRGDLVHLLGPSASTEKSITIVYPKFRLHRSNPHDLPDYETTVVGEAHGPAEPGEIVAVRDLMGLRYILELVNGCQFDADFTSNSTSPDPAEWPKNCLVAVGGPAVNQVTHQCLGPDNNYLAFDQHTSPWTVTIPGQRPLFTSNPGSLDYGFVVRTPHPTSSGDFVVMLFGEGAFGTEAACFYVKNKPAEAAKLIAKKGVIALEVRNGASTDPHVIYPPD